MTLPEFNAIVTDYLAEQKVWLAKPSYTARRCFYARFALQHRQQFKGEPISRATVGAWIQTRLTQVGIAFVNAERTWLTTVVLWAIAEGRLTHADNPLHRIRTLRTPDSKRECVTSEEYGKLMAYRWNHCAYMPYLIRIGWETGLRLGDCCCLRWEFISLEQALLRITPSKTLRLGKRLEIPIDGLVPMLRDLETRGVSPWLFPTAAADYKDHPSDVCEQFRLGANACGVSRTFHCLRHSFISRLAGAGVGIPTIRGMTGLSLNVLERYLHCPLDEKRAALAAVPSVPWEIPKPVLIAPDLSKLLELFPDEPPPLSACSPGGNNQETTPGQTGQDRT